MTTPLNSYALIPAINIILYNVAIALLLSSNSKPKDSQFQILGNRGVKNYTNKLKGSTVVGYSADVVHPP